MAGDILIVNDTRDAGYPYAPFFKDMGRDIVEDHAAFTLNPNRFGLVVFTGGSDVSPDLYGDESPKNICYCSKVRDRVEVKLFNIAYNKGVPMFGICRGLQFINVMSGGKLIHDLTGHQTGHTVSTSDEESFHVNSLHHQAVIPPMRAEVLAWSTTKRSMRYIGDKDEEWKYNGPEVEAVHYPHRNAAGVQWHPEALDPKDRGRTWAYILARDLVKGLNSEAMRKLYYKNRPKVNYVEVY